MKTMMKLVVVGMLVICAIRVYAYCTKPSNSNVIIVCTPQCDVLNARNSGYCSFYVYSDATATCDCFTPDCQADSDRLLWGQRVTYSGSCVLGGCMFSDFSSPETVYYNPHTEVSCSTGG